MCYVVNFKMSYNEFLATINENTNNQFEDYKWLCRFCLQKKSYGIDVGNDSHDEIQQRDALLNNFHIVTKEYLSVSPEYPNFVCSSCESKLSHNALFIHQIEQNAEHWKMFLNQEKASNVQINVESMIGIEEIKIEKTEDDIFETMYDEKPIGVSEIQPETPNLLSTSCSQEILPDNRRAEMNSRKRKRSDKCNPNVYHSYVTTEYERTCKLCNETLSSMRCFYKHQRQQHPGAKHFTCDICGSQFTKKHRMYHHMKDRHSECGKKHQCQYCAKLFFSDREMKGHEEIHLNARSYICKLCGKGFNQKSILNSHLKSKAHNAEYKPISKQKYRYKTEYRCELCVPSTVFKSAEERAIHKNTVHRTFECDICKNSFMAQESLDSHKLRHSDKPRRFVCSVCEATFNQSSHLASHYKRKHNGEKTFHCSHCDKSFFEGCDLNAHVNLVHVKKERVKCNECSSHFATEKYLQAHIIQKHSTNASLYDCKICGKRNINGARLDQHRLRYH